MAKTFHANYDPGSLDAGVTNYYVICGKTGSTTTQARRQVPIYSAGSFSDYKVNIFSNSLDVNATLGLQVAGSTVNNVVTVTASTTGYFTVTASDSVTSGQLVNYIASASAGSGVLRQRPSISFSASSNTAQLLIFGDGGASYIPDAGETIYWSLGDGTNDNTTESRFGFTFKTGGTLRNASYYTSGNAAAVNTTVRIRIDGANVNLAITVTAATTGLFQDTSNTDTVTDTDVINWSVGRSADSANLIGQFVAVEFITTDSTFQIFGGTNGTETAAAATSYFLVPGGAVPSKSTTEINSENTVGLSFVASNLEINIIANASITDGSFTLWPSGGSSALTTVITALTTGLYVDNTNTVQVNNGNTLNFNLITGSVGGYTLGTYGVKATTTADPVALSRVSTLSLLGCG